MQLLGKHYFEQEEVTEPVPVQNSCADGMENDGLEQLCEVVRGGHRIPAWMSAAAGMVRENRRHLAAAASVLVIGFAVYLNWAMADTDHAVVEGSTMGSGSAELSLNGVYEPEADVLSAEEVGGADDYFAVSQINRQRARDEAIAVLQDVVEGAANLSDVQSDALSQISQIAVDIENEAAIESLVKGKGFSDCVAVISGGNVNVIVRSSALLPNEIAQIQEIVYETAGILPANVKIIEK